MRIPIPSWFVAVAGASLAILSTVVLTFVVEQANEEADTLTQEIADLENEFGAQLQRYLRSEQLEMIADTMAAFMSFRDVGIVDRFVLPRVGKYAVDTIGVLQGTAGYVTFPMVPATKQPVDALMDKANSLAQQLSDGNLNAFDALAGLAEDEQGIVAHRINEIRKEVREAEVERVESRARAARWRYIQVSLNILGLIMVLLKDVPIWGIPPKPRDPRRDCRPTR